MLLLSLSSACGRRSKSAVPADAASTVWPTPEVVIGDTSSPSSDSGTQTFPVTPCGDPGTGLAGTRYDIARSRFAFGSSATRQVVGGVTTWTGTDGAVVIGLFGYRTTGTMKSAGDPRARHREWSADPAAMTTHVRDYWIAMGVPPCQIEESNGGRTRSSLRRSLDTIPIVESGAWASIDSADRSTEESFRWPAIPPDVVASARAFRAQIADPAGLAAFKAKLPVEARGDGVLVIHHNEWVMVPPFIAVATWDVTFARAKHMYDANGVEVVQVGGKGFLY